MRTLGSRFSLGGPRIQRKPPALASRLGNSPMVDDCGRNGRKPQAGERHQGEARGTTEKRQPKNSVGPEVSSGADGLDERLHAPAWLAWMGRVR